MTDQPERRRYLTSTRAAELAGVSRRALFTLAGRARAAGVELHAPRGEWPDARTPLWDSAALGAYLAARPGRGANLRRDRYAQCDATCTTDCGACKGQGRPEDLDGGEHAQR